MGIGIAYLRWEGNARALAHGMSNSSDSRAFSLWVCNGIEQNNINNKDKKRNKMKRLSVIMMCLFTMMAVSLSAVAQEVTITLFPGWNWISYPKAEVQDVNTALGDFVPVNGDILKSQFGSSSYANG